jgi:phenylacetate-CoA ligase
MLLDFLTGIHEARSIVNAKRNEIEILTARRLRLIIEEAYRKVPFYSRIFRTRNLSPTDIRNVQDLSKLPILTRKDVMERYGDLLNQDFQPENCIRKRTSGSTGEPVDCLFDPEGFYRYDGIALRGQFQAGLKVTDRVAVVGFRDAPNKIYRILSRFGRVKYCSLYEETGATLSALRIFQPTVLKTSPSYLRVLTENNEPLDSPLIITVGEVLDQNLRRRVEANHGARIVDLYGSAEFTSIAWQCKESSFYHLDSDAVVVEALRLDSDIPATEGERARIVVTGLLNHAMPLIRYEIGDLGVFTDEECSCGIKLPLLKRIEGRRVDCIRLPSGRLLSPYILTNTIRDLDSIRQYQIVQEQTNKIVIKIVPRMNPTAFNEKNIPDLVNSMKRLLTEEVNIQIEIVESIRLGQSGKNKEVLSKVS